MAQLLAHTDLNEEQRDFVKTILNSGESLLKILNDILDLSKIDSQHLELEKIPVNVNDCIQEVLSLFTKTLTEKGLELRYKANLQLNGYFLCDPNRLRQILLNLVSNAIKFTETGCISVECHGRMINKSLYELHFQVRDTGIGVPNDLVDKLFQPFSQVDSSISRKYGGTGLGLAICKKLCELMGGQIWVETVWGRGSTFHFTIAAALVELDRPSQISANRADQVLATVLPLKILIADDNVVNQKVLNHSLKRLGYSADIVGNGLEVLARLKTQEQNGENLYDVIFMDVQMPEMDGLEATRQICQLWTLHPYIIAMTAQTRPEDHQACLAAGMSDYLGKPFKLEDLEASLRYGFSSRLP